MNEIMKSPKIFMNRASLDLYGIRKYVEREDNKNNIPLKQQVYNG